MVDIRSSEPLNIVMEFTRRREVCVLGWRINYKRVPEKLLRSMFGRES